VNAFREADFYSLRNDYVGDVTEDSPLNRTSIEIDGQVKQVSERGLPFLDDMPATVSKLEDSIDSLANSQTVDRESSPI
jgi:hypothetical protein